MGDPVAVARHVRQALAEDGAWMIVEPNAGDRLEDNLNPGRPRLLRILDHVVHPKRALPRRQLTLGAQAGEARLRKALTAAGFTRFRRAAETPFNLILEARP